MRDYNNLATNIMLKCFVASLFNCSSSLKFKGSLMSYCRYLITGLFVLFFITPVIASPATSFLPEQAYDMDIFPPSKVLGFDVGQRHPRHDQVLSYFDGLERQSNRIMLTDIGRTNELRKQFLVTISSKENLANLDALLEKRTYDKKSAEDEPLVVWLGYSVHGDEISGTNAALVVAYHLAASKSEAVAKLLENTIIVLEPSINPDGMDRFVNWVNTYRGATFNADPNHIEHYQQWRTGRTNHFGFDLNRDWLLLSQKETQNRIPYFYKYQPHVLGDFHEMGPNSSYFFQPGIPSRNNPLTPTENTRLTEKLAEFHASALDKTQRLYYSQESFDDFYYGKGSTYPDINGAVGILFEQASSRGVQQDTINGLLTFEQSVRNQVTTSLSTIEGAWHSQQHLKNYRQKFYKEAIKLADKEKFSGYLISEEKDHHRLNVLLEKLKSHQIEVYPLESDFRVRDTVYRKESSFYIPLEQLQYRVVKALFSTDTDFPDNTFYDVSGWTMPLAMNITFEKVERTWGLKLAKTTWQATDSVTAEFIPDAYAYAFEWHHYLAPKLLQSLLKNNIKARVATKDFTSLFGEDKRAFKQGTIVIPAGIQTNENWQKDLARAANEINIEVMAINTGLTVQGSDFGSNSFRPVTPVNVLMIGGKGISQYEAAEILFYLDQQLQVPVTIVEKARLARTSLTKYSHIIMVDGNYSDIGSTFSPKLERWLKQGGVVISQKRAAKWLSDNSTLKANFVNKHQIDQMFDTEGLAYQDKEALAARKRIAGAIFSSELDTSHPLAFGFSDANLPVFRNNTLIMELPEQPFITVAKYTDAPLLSGYTDKNLVNRIANNAAVVAHNFGKGRVIATADTLAFRGYWLGSEKLLANSLFFAKAFSASASN